MGRALAAIGHRVVGVDVTWDFAYAASRHKDAMPVAFADAARLPIRDGAANLVVAFMSLLDIDDYVAAIGEAGRVLVPGGRFCFAIVHPLAESGRFGDDGSFVLTRTYGDTWRYPDLLNREGVEKTFHSEHRPLEAYARALESVGFVIETIREPRPDSGEMRSAPHEDRWRRVPTFLMMRARTIATHPGG